MLYADIVLQHLLVDYSAEVCNIKISTSLHLSDHLSKKSCHNEFHQIFCAIPVAVTWSSSDRNTIRYVLPVLWMEPCFHIMEQIGQNQRQSVFHPDCITMGISNSILLVHVCFNFILVFQYYSGWLGRKSQKLSTFVPSRSIKQDKKSLIQYFIVARVQSNFWLQLFTRGFHKITRMVLFWSFEATVPVLSYYHH